MTMDFPSGEISGLETLTIFWKSPSSIFRACAFAGLVTVEETNAARIPRNRYRANRAEHLVVECVNMRLASTGSLTRASYASPALRTTNSGAREGLWAIVCISRCLCLSIEFHLPILRESVRVRSLTRPRPQARMAPMQGGNTNIAIGRWECA